MRSLIVEDEFTNRKILQEILTPYGDCDVVVDGEEAIHAFVLAWKEGNPYDLICMDIMMPNMDGQQALRRIREMEEDMGITGEDEVKVIMTTALDDPKTVIDSYKGGATTYYVKPISKKSFLEKVQSMGLIEVKISA